MKSKMSLESHLSSKTSLKRFSVFMLFSILVCCVSSIISNFNNKIEICQKSKSQAVFSNEFSSKCFGVIAQNEFENLLEDVDCISQLGFASRIIKRSADNELRRGLLSFDLSKVEIGYYSSLSFELKSQEKFNSHTIKRNIGISERFQV